MQVALHPANQTTPLLKDKREQIALKEANAIRDRVALSVTASQGQRPRRDIDGDDPGLGQVHCQRNGDGAAADTDVRDAHLSC